MNQCKIRPNPDENCSVHSPVSKDDLSAWRRLLVYPEMHRHHRTRSAGDRYIEVHFVLRHSILIR
jgi:hypothetical protein